MAVSAQRLEVGLPARGPIGVADRPRSARLPFAMLMLAVLASMLLGLVTAQTLVTQNSFRIAELRDRADRLERDFGQLRLRAAELSAPERLQRAARRAGMALPEQVEVISVPGIKRLPEDRPGGTLAIKGMIGSGG